MTKPSTNDDLDDLKTELARRFATLAAAGQVALGVDLERSSRQGLRHLHDPEREAARVCCTALRAHLVAGMGPLLLAACRGEAEGTWAVYPTRVRDLLGYVAKGDAVVDAEGDADGVAPADAVFWPAAAEDQARHLCRLHGHLGLGPVGVDVARNVCGLEL